MDKKLEARIARLESTATGREVDLIKAFAKKLLDKLGSDWSLVDSFFDCPAAVLHIPTNTTYHIDADATARLNNRGDLKVVFSEQPNSIGSSYSSGSCYTDEIDRAVQLLKYNTRRIEKWLEKHPYESLEYSRKLERRISRLERAMNRKSIKNEVDDANAASWAEFDKVVLDRMANEDVNSQAELENHIGDLLDELRESYRSLIKQYKSAGDEEMASLRRTELRALNELSNMRY